MVDMKQYDRNAFTEIWHIMRDFNDIEVGEDSRWKDFLDKADDIDRRFPEYARVVASVIMILEDRSKEKYLKQEQREEVA